MQKRLVMIMLFGISCSLHGWAQQLNKTLEFSRTKAAIDFFLKEIEQKIDIRFSYSRSRIDMTRAITLPQKSMTLRAFLDLAFDKTDILVIEKGKSILLKPKGESPDKKKATISGHINTAETGENLIGAHAYSLKTSEGAVSNYYGFYSLTLSVGGVSLIYSYTGYENQLLTFELKSDTVININLSPTQLEEVVVSAVRPDPIQEVSGMGTVTISSRQIKSRPVLAGEVDVIKALQLLPGVQSGHEGSSGLYVRGGGPDQNLILLDGVPVYNISHLFGFISVFNADAIQHVKLVKGAFPAHYGGRLSSVVEISVREGNNREFHAEGSLGLVASKLTLEGPIAKEKTSFMLSGRRTYIDLLAKPFAEKPITEPFGDGTREVTPSNGYFFYDVNAKLNHRFSDRDRLYFSAYSGRDVGYSRFKSVEKSSNLNRTMHNDSDLGWGSSIALLRWNHVINKKLFSNLSISYSSYDFSSKNNYQETRADDQRTQMDFLWLSSGIDDLSAKIDVYFYPNPAHAVRSGFNVIRHTFTPNVVGMRSETARDTTYNAQNIKATEFALYIEDDFNLSTAIKANAGVHLSGFRVNGKFYTSVQPRLSGRYLLNENTSLKAAYSRMAQYLNLLTNPGIGLPTDFWTPPTDRIKPQLANQFSVGFAYTHPVREIEFSVEAYHKAMTNLIAYEEGAGFLKLNENWQDKITTGRGSSYGVELFIRKSHGNTEGWAGYTLSWSNRQFEGLNGGRAFPFKFDRRHDISAVLDHKISDKIHLSANWVYGTGVSLTLPQAQYFTTERHSITDDLGLRYLQRYHYEEKNSFRMRAYHRLDLGISFNKKKKWGERDWVIGVYNVYNRKNPFYIEQYAEYDADSPGSKAGFLELTLFPIIPSLSYRFKF